MRVLGLWAGGSDVICGLSGIESCNSPVVLQQTSVIFWSKLAEGIEWLPGP